MKNFIITILLCFFSNSIAACDSGLIYLTGSNYSIYKSCEGSLGDYIGIMFTGKWSDSGSNIWSIGDRFWYDPSWGNSVTSHYYNDSSDVLYVATSGTYGTAGIYKLDLKSKKSELLYEPESPEQDEGEFKINNINPSNDNELMANFICFQNACDKKIVIELQENN